MLACKPLFNCCDSLVSMLLHKKEAKEDSDRSDNSCGLRPQEYKTWMEKFRPKNAKVAAGGQARKFLEQEFDSLARVASETAISCTTFNILAPIYKRFGGETCRESHFHDAWLSRNQSIVDMLLLLGSSIICLQEFWLENKELVQLYEDSLNCAGYTTYKLARTNNRGDGLLTAIKMDQLRVLDYRPLFFYDCGDRVAQIFHLRVNVPYYKRNHLEQDVLLVNTHLLFPHDSTFCRIRLRQVHKIIECLDQFEKENGLSSVPVILCGDWNGSKRGHVYKFLRAQGYVSSYDTVHSYTDTDAHRWISHRNHRGNLCGVDFIWLRNPSVLNRFTSSNWEEVLLDVIKSNVCEGGFSEENALGLFELDKEPKASNFCGWERRLQEDIIPRDVDSASLLKMVGDRSLNFAGFGISNAFLFPPEVEQGYWPENYSLSDHAPLTAVFEPFTVCD